MNNCHRYFNSKKNYVSNFVLMYVYTAVFSFKTVVFQKLRWESFIRWLMMWVVRGKDSCQGTSSGVSSKVMSDQVVRV